MYIYIYVFIYIYIYIYKNLSGNLCPKLGDILLYLQSSTTPACSCQTQPLSNHRLKVSVTMCFVSSFSKIKFTNGFRLNSFWCCECILLSKVSQQKDQLKDKLKNKLKY